MSDKLKKVSVDHCSVSLVSQFDGLIVEINNIEKFFLFPNFVWGRIFHPVLLDKKLGSGKFIFLGGD